MAAPIANEVGGRFSGCGRQRRGSAAHESGEREGGAGGHDQGDGKEWLEVHVGVSAFTAMTRSTRGFCVRPEQIWRFRRKCPIRPYPPRYAVLRACFVKLCRVEREVMCRG